MIHHIVQIWCDGECGKKVNSSAMVDPDIRAAFAEAQISGWVKAQMEFFCPDCAPRALTRCPHCKAPARLEDAMEGSLTCHRCHRFFNLVPAA